MKQLFVLCALTLFSMIVHSTPKVSVIVDGQKMACGKSGGGNGGKESFGCRCHQSGSYTYLKYIKFNHETGQEQQIRDITYWYGSESNDRCQAEKEINVFCNKPERKQLKTIYGCNCYKSGSYTYLKYTKYDRDQGTSSNIRDITYWYGSDSLQKCTDESERHYLCNNSNRRPQKAELNDCKCTKSGSYAYLKYYKYQRDTGQETHLRDITYWYGSDSMDKCRMEKQTHGLCKKQPRRRRQ